MINKNFFFKGYRSIFTHDSPAIALTCCFIAIKQQVRAIAGLSCVNIDLYPLKKKFLLIIIHLGTVYQHQGFEVNRLLYLLLQFAQILKRILYLQTPILFWHFAQLE